MTAIGLVMIGIAMVGEYLGWIVLAAGVAGVGALVVGLVGLYRRRRRRYLLGKYRDEALVASLLEQRFWEGQTADQLFDALGEPHDVDQKMLKTKKKEIWKYDHRGHNRYDLRITLDNDVVVGWDQKD